MSTVAQEATATMRELGYPEHVIQGFLMNYQDESGLDPTITEAEANVHGTYGKGLYQLTGDRRTAFEEKYNGDWSVRNQILHQDWELQNTETKARDAIFASQDAGEAGAAIVSKFLRPAEEHRVARENKYRGTPPPALPEGGVPAPVEEEEGVPELTGIPTLDGILDDAKNTAIDGAGEMIVSSLFGSGGSNKAPAPPPLPTMRQPQFNMPTGGTIFRIKRSTDKEKS